MIEVSVIVLTLDEERHLDTCLAARPDLQPHRGRKSKLLFLIPRLWEASSFALWILFEV